MDRVMTHHSIYATSNRSLSMIWVGGWVREMEGGWVEGKEGSRVGHVTQRRSNSAADVGGREGGKTSGQVGYLTHSLPKSAAHVGGREGGKKGGWDI